MNDSYTLPVVCRMPSSQVRFAEMKQVSSPELWICTSVSRVVVHVLANELRGRNITVNAVAPGPVGTELFLSRKTEEQVAELTRLAPLERLGEPEDIAHVVSFLGGPEG